MNDDEHAANLGKLMANLHGLEFTLRAFLAKRNASNEPGVNLRSAGEGDWVAVNSFTNYDPLCRLVNKFNAIVQNPHPEALIDSSVVAVRDAIAHGRIAGEAPSFPMTLMKFGKPKNGKVQIITKVVMDHAWFKAKVNLVREQIEKVYSASRSMGMKIIEMI